MLTGSFNYRKGGKAFAAFMLVLGASCLVPCGQCLEQGEAAAAGIWLIVLLISCFFAFGVLQSVKNCKIRLDEDRITIWDWQGKSQTVLDSQMAAWEPGVQRQTFFILTQDG